MICMSGMGINRRGRNTRGGFHSAHALLSIRDTAIQSPEKKGEFRGGTPLFFPSESEKRN